MDGNIQIGIGLRFDTGKKWIDPATNLPHVIYSKTLALDGTTSSLPNAATKNVLHGEAIALGKWAEVVALRADNGVIIKTLASTGITVDLNATQIAITTVADLSLYLRGMVTIEFCL